VPAAINEEQQVRFAPKASAGPARSMRLDRLSGQIQGAHARPSVFFAAAMSPNKLGGVESFSIELARQLDKKGWDLILCFQDLPHPQIEKLLLAPGNVSLTAMQNQLGMGLSNVKEFVQLL